MGGSRRLWRWLKWTSCSIARIVLDLYIEEDFREHTEKFHEGADPFVCKECHTAWQNREGLVDHMREHHYFTCTKCDLYFHGKRHYARHERSCGEDGDDDGVRAGQVEKKMARFVEGMELLRQANEEIRDTMAGFAEQTMANARQTSACLQAITNSQTVAKVPVAKEQKFPDFEKGQEFETFQKKVMMWQKDSRLSREGKVLAFTQAFSKRSEDEKKYVDSKMVQGDSIDM